MQRRSSTDDIHHDANYLLAPFAASDYSLCCHLKTRVTLFKVSEDPVDVVRRLTTWSLASTRSKEFLASCYARHAEVPALDIRQTPERRTNRGETDEQPPFHHRKTCDLASCWQCENPRDFCGCMRRTWDPSACPLFQFTNASTKGEINPPNLNSFCASLSPLSKPMVRVMN